MTINRGACIADCQAGTGVRPSIDAATQAAVDAMDACDSAYSGPPLFRGRVDNARWAVAMLVAQACGRLRLRGRALKAVCRIAKRIAPSGTSATRLYIVSGGGWEA